MELSIPTLFVTIIVTGLALAGAIAVVAFRRDNALLPWSVAIMLHTFAYVLFALRGKISDFLSIVVANTTLSVTFALFAVGVGSFQRRRLPALVVWGPVAVVVIAFSAFVANTPVRLILGGIFFSVQAMIPLLALFQYRHQTYGRGQYILMTGFLLILIIFGVRIIATLVGNAEMLSVMATNQIQYITFLTSITSLMLLATGLLLMVQEQSEHELRDSRELLQQQNLSLKQYSTQLEEANRKLAELSITDSLTGLLNRRRFDEMLQTEWSRALRAEQSLAVLMIDVDLFKSYNDHYGHQAGDECLTRIAHVIQTNARRAGDLAARYGGEEFVVIAADTGLAKARELAEALCAGVAGLNAPHDLSPHGRVTVSVGVAAAVVHEGMTSEALVRLADEALYRAKNLGRNRAEA
jgi:diguanylate cyclase (GGDEF)-like protein